MRTLLFIIGLLTAVLSASGQDVSPVETHQLVSKVFDNTRALRVLVPPGYADANNAKMHYPILYLNDGAMVFKRFDIQKTVHGLINAGAVPSLIIVGIDNGGSTDKTKNAGTDRANEYLPYPDVGFGPDNLYHADPADPAGRKYPDFLNEVMAFIESKYRVKKGPENTGIGGASYGGVAAIYAVMNRPGVFGKLLIESTPLWIGPDKRLLRDIAEIKAWPGKVYIGLGTKETPNESVNNAGRADFDRFITLLRKKAGKTELRSVLEPEAKHEPTAWARRFPEALKFLYGNGSPHFEKVRAIADSSLLAGVWEGEVTRDGKRWKVALNALENGNELKASIDFIDLDVIDIPFPVTRSGERFRLERPQPSGNPIVFDGEVIGNSFLGKWNGFGVDGSFAMKRSVARAKAYRGEEVSFSSGDVTLSGTLLIPNDREKSPAVVLVHGSSPNERTTYRSWARHFAENGIAALIYDKRGSGKSTGNTRAASMEDLADDALAGIKMLKLRRDINAGKVGIAGHSQSGWIAPLAAARSGDVAFVIVSAAAAVTPAEQSIFHRAGVMREAGMTDVEIGEATRLREQLYLLNRKILANDADVSETRSAISKELSDNKSARWFSPAELPPELNGELPPRGALELLFFDVSSIWPKVKVPVLAIWGSRDTVVPVEKSRTIIEELLNKAGNKDLTIKVFEGVDHGKGVSTASGGWDFPRASAEYDLAMVEWLKKKLG